MQLIPFIEQRCFWVMTHTNAAHLMNIQARCLFRVGTGGGSAGHDVTDPAIVAEAVAAAR